MVAVEGPHFSSTVVVIGDEPNICGHPLKVSVLFLHRASYWGTYRSQSRCISQKRKVTAFQAIRQTTNIQIRLLATLFMTAAPFCSASRTSSAITVSALRLKKPLERFQKDTSKEIKLTAKRQKVKKRTKIWLCMAFYRYMNDMVKVKLFRVLRNCIVDCIGSNRLYSRYEPTMWYHSLVG